MANKNWLLKGMLEDLPEVKKFSEGSWCKDAKIENDSADLIVSHATWGYIGGDPFAEIRSQLSDEEKKALAGKRSAAQVKALKDTLRILAPGGTARMNLVYKEVQERFLREFPPADKGFNYVNIEVTVPAGCNALLDGKFHLSDDQKHRFLLLVKDAKE